MRLALCKKAILVEGDAEFISAAQINMSFVGDFHQHTFDTSRDGNVNVNLHENYDAYKKKFELG